VTAAAVAGLVVVPVAYLAYRAAGADREAWDLILRARTLWLAVRSLGLAASVTGASLLIGVPLAWLVVRTDLPGRRVWGVLAALPLAFPSYVGALAVLAALGPRGLLQQLLEGPFGVERLPSIAGFPGAFLSLTLFTYPYVYLICAAGLRGLDPSLEEVARTLGRDRWSTFRSVVLPLIRPSVAAGGLLVALYTLHDFGAVSLMRYQAFTQAIFLQYKAAFDRTPAAILSLMLVILAIGVLVAEFRLRGRARYHRLGSGATRPPRPAALGRWRWPSILFVGGVVLMALVLPVTVLVVWLARGIVAGTAVPPAFDAALNSLAVSGLGAALCLVAALPLALLATRHPGRPSAILERTAYGGYGLPGLVVALAFVFLTAGALPSLYQTIPLVALAYVVLFLPQASEPLRAGLLRVGPRMEEAGRVLGRGRLPVLARVVIPLVARGAIVGFALVFLTAMKELPATLLLRPTGFETLATDTWAAASVGLYGRAAVPALLLVALTAIPLVMLARRLQVPEAGGW
jgi:iron(III) transport system permease protein